MDCSMETLSINGPAINSGEKEVDVQPSLMDPSVALIVLPHTFRFLRTPDLIRASQVSRLWYLEASRQIYWRTVRLNGCYISDVQGLARSLKNRCSEALDLRGIVNGDLRLTAPGPWTELFFGLRELLSLKRLELEYCPGYVLQMVAVCGMRNSLNSVSMVLGFASGPVDLRPIGQLKNLREVCVKFQNYNYRMYIENASAALNLESLCVVMGWISEEFVRNDSMTRHRSTTVGSLPALLPMKFPNLKKLSLGDRFGMWWDSNEVLASVNSLESLTDLELTNCVIGTAFEEYLGACKRLKKVFIAPRYKYSAVTCHQVVMRGASRLRNSLDSFTLGVYKEFGALVERLNLYCAHCRTHTPIVRWPCRQEIHLMLPASNCSCEVQPCGESSKMQWCSVVEVRQMLHVFMPKVKSEILIM